MFVPRKCKNLRRVKNQKQILRRVDLIKHFCPFLLPPGGYTCWSLESTRVTSRSLQMQIRDVYEMYTRCKRVINYN